MGFGLATLGYGFLLTYEAGGGMLSALLIGYGLYLASALNRRFLIAAIAALGLFPHSVVKLLKLWHFEPGRAVEMVTQAIFLCALITLSIFFFEGVREIALKNKSQKLADKARTRLYITLFYCFGAFLTLMMPGLLNDLRLGAFFIVYFYAMVIVNTLFFHTCFLLITSEKQYEKDKQRVLEEEEKIRRKKNQKNDEDYLDE